MTTTSTSQSDEPAESSPNNDRLVSFLRDLAEQIETQTLPINKIQRIGEFFVRYHGEEELEQSNDLSDDDFTRFLFLGLYVYRFLLNNNR